MNLIKRIALPALAVLALAAGPAAAQGIQSHIRYIEQGQRLGPFAGWMFTDPKLELNDSTTAELGPQSAPIFGLNYEVRASGPLSVFASLGYIASTRKVFLAEAVNDSAAIRPIDTNREANVGILLGEAGLLFHLTGPRTYRGLAPYVGARVGYARQIAGKDSADASVPEQERYRFGPAFAVGATLGTQLFVSRRLSVGLELNGRLWRESAPAGFRAAGQSKLTEWNNASSAQIGAALHF
jgi:opacity protein-like surface antigen